VTLVRAAGRTPHTYFVYGLRLLSDTALPEIDPGLGVDPAPAAEVEVRLGDPPATSLDVEWHYQFETRTGQPWLACGRTPRGHVLRFPGLADFVVEASDRGCRIRLGDAAAPPGTLRHLLLDQVLPRALGLMGLHALHAASVLTPAGAVALLGPSGSGKSSLAAALARPGAQVLGDDCLPLRVDGEWVKVRPGYPGLRLWGDVRDRLGLREGEPLPHAPTKHRIGSGEVSPGEQTLIAIYVLEWKDRVEILTQAASQAAMALLSNSFLLDPASPTVLEAQLRFCGRIAERVPVRRLVLTDDRWTMPTAARLLWQEATTPLRRGRPPAARRPGATRPPRPSPGSPRTPGRRVVRPR
jgi:hypothetical protein